MPKAVKRKNDVITPTDLAQSDDEEPPQLTAQQLAKKAFRESLAEPVPPSKHSGAGGNTCSVEGIVLKGRKIMVSQKGTQVPKWMMDVAVMKVMGNGCKDVVTTGIDGVAYCLPTKATEASPEEIAKNKDAKGPIVLDVIDGNSSANYLGIVSASFYMDPNPTKGDTGPAVESCVPGTRVLISNVVSTYGRDGAGGRLYCNAKKATPLSEVKPGEGAARIIEEARTNAAQQAASFLLSATMGGFFGLTYNDPALQQQADSAKEKWSNFLATAAAKCEASAISLGNDPAAQFMNANSARIKEIKPQDAAAGAPVFMCNLGQDLLTPYTAPIVQYNISPGNRDPDYCISLYDPEMRDRVPTSFVEGLVTDVTCKGNLVTVDFQLFFVPNKAAALASIDDGKTPVLKSKHAAASVKFSKRGIAPELLGTLSDKKTEMGLKEIIPFANLAIYAPIFPRGADDVQLNGHFAETAGIDIADGIRKVGVAVSEKWLDDTMLGGRGVFIHSPTDGEVMIEPKNGCCPSPILKNSGYQALSEGSFDFDGLRVAEGKEKIYRIVYSGCSKDVEDNDKLCANTASGEEHISAVAANGAGSGNLRDFLRQECLVYAVAVPK
tara:strand:+ start:3416 stop:5242 length:1827 start_codon:yes stop_codon:yes gene_type:complete